ncbi:MAG: undecaprenyldiphospho-muramoylpentapeptide beta-N-acetylglucosaminyltransferase [Deltaproteobacteria bacterium]|nr:undecaprenyldiphospho-muramoylpentapeptide beta-N-acetylglucosaminyltransferase [Deltaproteobacteria bacterium]
MKGLMAQHQGSEDKDPDEPRVIIAGGGTGGHLFPGLAIANEVAKRHARSEILFITGHRKIESDILTRSGFHQVAISVEGIKGRGWKRGIIAILRLPYSLLQSIWIIRRLSPHLVLGVGGYSSGPACLAARIMGIPTAVHEQNSFPGLTNRLLCRIVDRVFISFEESRDHFPGGTIYLTGNPIRREILEKREHLEKIDKRFTILVMGGSQGASAINRAFVSALEILKDKGKDPHVIHQTGNTDFARVAEEYRRRGLQGDIIPFIKEMPRAYQQADIVVSRAGATTVAELAGLGMPSVLIPYPYAANRHQDTNARILVKVGGAEMVLQDDLSADGLAELLMRYMDDRAALKRMGEQALRVGRPDAVKVIVDQLEDMAGLNSEQ